VAADEGQNSFGVSKATSGVDIRVAVRESAGDEVEIWISQIIRSRDWAVECPMGGGVYDAGDAREVTRFVISVAENFCSI
jgi:hypothetical protein